MIETDIRVSCLIGQKKIADILYTLKTRRVGWFRWEAVLASEFGELRDGPYWSRRRAWWEMFKLARSCGIRTIQD